MARSGYFRARIRSFGYAFKGIATLIRTQPHARIHLVATLLVIGAGVFFRVSRGEWALLALCTGMVWTAEALNTAIEFLTDLASPEHHPLAGKAKDLAAAAVLIAAFIAAVVAGIIFIPRIIAWETVLS